MFILRSDTEPALYYAGKGDDGKGDDGDVKLTAELGDARAYDMEPTLLLDWLNATIGGFEVVAMIE